MMMKPLLITTITMLAAGAGAQTSRSTVNQNGSTTVPGASRTAQGEVSSTGWNYDRPSSEEVRRVQGALNARGASIQEDGVLGPQTQSALRTIQANEGLPVSGQLNPRTIDLLGLNPLTTPSRAPASVPMNSPVNSSGGLTPEHQLNQPINRPTGPNNPSGTITPGPATPTTPGSPTMPNGATQPPNNGF